MLSIWDVNNKERSLWADCQTETLWTGDVGLHTTNPSDNTQGKTLVNTIHSPAKWGAEVGDHVWIDLPEMGMSGWALVTAIEDCPTIKAGQGRLVIGWYKHVAGVVYDLCVEGDNHAIEVTGTHPFRSADRQD